MKAPKHLVALAESDEASLPATATIREMVCGSENRQAGWHQTRYRSAQSLIKKAL